MREDNMAIVANSIWEKAHKQNLHQHIQEIKGKSFRSCNSCILSVLTDAPEAIKAFLKDIDIVETWGAIVLDCENGFEIVFD